MIALTVELSQEQLNAICAELLIPSSSIVRTECKVTFKVHAEEPAPERFCEFCTGVKRHNRYCPVLDTQP